MLYQLFGCNISEITICMWKQPHQILQLIKQTFKE